MSATLVFGGFDSSERQLTHHDTHRPPLSKISQTWILKLKITTQECLNRLLILYFNISLLSFGECSPVLPVT